jgi:hypothetical protein
MRLEYSCGPRVTEPFPCRFKAVVAGESAKKDTAWTPDRRSEIQAVQQNHLATAKQLLGSNYLEATTWKRSAWLSASCSAEQAR